MRTSTWESIGTDITSAKSIGDALTLSGLDFTVNKQPMYSKIGDSEILIPNKVATIREDTGEVLGVVGQDYSVCQNRDAFEFVDFISDDLVFEKAGQTYSGMMYVIAKLPDVTILGDTFTPHIIFQNGFNGGYSVRAAICPLRVVCQNQFALSFKKTNNSVSIRHSASLTDKLAAAKTTFLETADYMKELNAQAEILAAKPFSKNDFRNFVNTQFPILPNMSDLQKQRIEDLTLQMWKAYCELDNSNFVGTAWAAVNAVADVVTHKAPTRKSANFTDSQFMSVTFNPTLLQAIYERVSA